MVDIQIFSAGSPYAIYFGSFNLDCLLLLTLAAYRLKMSSLKTLCVAVIASKFSAMDQNEVLNDLYEHELVTDEEDNMLWSGFKW